MVSINFCSFLALEVEALVAGVVVIEPFRPAACSEASLSLGIVEASGTGGGRKSRPN